MLRNALVAAALALACLGRADAAQIVNDITQLNPVEVERVIAPTTVSEIQAAVAMRRGPVSIGGARHSQGGQTACRGCLFIDMRRFDRVLALDVGQRTITVQPGITWRAIQQRIDSEGLSAAIMQDFASFTVGGTLSVNAHGNYVGRGPVINSVRSLKIVLADGALASASRTENPDLFYGAIGGYGGLGVIVEATLDLAENQRVERTVHKLPLTGYPAYFASIVADEGVVMHSARLYPPDYRHALSVNYTETTKPLTIEQRLSPTRRPSRFDLWLLDFVTGTAAGKWVREYVYDPIRIGPSAVMWRNYVTSRDAAELEPASRAERTYVLQEYFVPVARFESFTAQMREILKRNDTNVLNIAIRHAPAETGTLLSWARTDVFCFVLYTAQGTTAADRAKVGAWTRELIEAAISEGGAHYLPYQVHATERQFHAAYPRANEFFALKRRVDPDYRFRNALFDAYYRP